MCDCIKETWPKTINGRYICSKQTPMPAEGHQWGRWEHQDVSETDFDSDYTIELKCHSCGRVWREELPE